MTHNYIFILIVFRFCVASDRLRADVSNDEQAKEQAADTALFKALESCNSSVPVIVACTRFDQIVASCKYHAQDALKDEKGYESDTELDSEDLAVIKSETEIKTAERKAELLEDIRLAAGDVSFRGPIYTQKSKTEKKEIFQILSRDANLCITDKPKTFDEVVEQTTEALDIDAVRLIFIAGQTCNVDKKIIASIQNSLRLYGHAIRTSAIPVAFTGVIASAAVSAIICTDILGNFGCPKLNINVASLAISDALLSNYETNILQALAQALNTTGLLLAETGVGLPASIAMWGGASLVNTIAIPQYGRLLLMLTVDVILIMERVFWAQDQGDTIVELIESACKEYTM